MSVEPPIDAELGHPAPSPLQQFLSTGVLSQRITDNPFEDRHSKDGTLGEPLQSSNTAGLKAHKSNAPPTASSAGKGLQRTDTLAGTLKRAGSFAVKSTRSFGLGSVSMREVTQLQPMRSYADFDGADMPEDDRFAGLAEMQEEAHVATVKGLDTMDENKQVIILKEHEGSPGGHDTSGVLGMLEEFTKTPVLKPTWARLKFMQIVEPYNIIALFSFLCNLVPLIIAACGKSEYIKMKAPVFGLWSILVSVCFRNEVWMWILHWVPVKVLGNRAPMWARHTIVGFLLHSGGIHSGLGVSALMWLIYSGVENQRHSSVIAQSIIGLTWTITALLAISVIAAIPVVRYLFHDYFEVFHRFAGWTTLAVLWAFIFVAYSFDPYTGDRWHFQGHRLVNNTEIWAVSFITFLIVLPWTLTRKIDCEVEIPSPAVTLLKFKGGMEAGFFGRISRNPLLEWHAFALVATDKGKDAGHFMIIGAVGDFTKRLQTDPPTKVWTRLVRFVGLPYLVRLYKRALVVCTGAGVAVVVPNFLQGYGDPHHLLWVAKDVRKTFGDQLCDIVLKRNNVTLYDTGKGKRPNLMDITAKLYYKLEAEVVFVTSNPRGTTQCVEGCRALGIPAFGPVFDS